MQSRRPRKPPPEVRCLSGTLGVRMLFSWAAMTNAISGTNIEMETAVDTKYFASCGAGVAWGSLFMHSGPILYTGTMSHGSNRIAKVGEAFGTTCINTL